MQPLDAEKKPAVHTTPLNHVGLWVNDLPAAGSGYSANGGGRPAPACGAAGLTHHLPTQGQRGIF